MAPVHGASSESSKHLIQLSRVRLPACHTSRSCVMCFAFFGARATLRMHSCASSTSRILYLTLFHAFARIRSPARSIESGSSAISMREGVASSTLGSVVCIHDPASTSSECTGSTCAKRRTAIRSRNGSFLVIEWQSHFALKLLANG